MNLGFFSKAKNLIISKAKSFPKLKKIFTGSAIGLAKYAKLRAKGGLERLRVLGRVPPMSNVFYTLAV